MNTSVAERPEARRAPRFALEQIVAIKSLDGCFEDASGVSRDVSACGIYFHVDQRLPIGATVEVYMMMPQNYSGLTDAIFPLRCYGAIVRVVENDGRYGVGVAFQKVDVLAEG